MSIIKSPLRDVPINEPTANFYCGLPQDMDPLERKAIEKAEWFLQTVNKTKQDDVLITLAQGVLDDLKFVVIMNRGELSSEMAHMLLVMHSFVIQLKLARDKASPDEEYLIRKMRTFRAFVDINLLPPSLV